MTAAGLLPSILPRCFPRDPRLVQRSERNTTVEDTKTVAFDLSEQRAIYRGHHQAGALSTSVTLGERGECFRIGGSRALDLVRHEILERGRELAPENICVADAKTP